MMLSEFCHSVLCVVHELERLHALRPSMILIASSDSLLNSVSNCIFYFFQEHLLDLISLVDAVSLGVKVYSEWLERKKISDFHTKMKIYFDLQVRLTKRC